MTVAGPIDGEALGHTQTHEHLLCAFDRSWRGLVHILADVDVLAGELARYREAGGGTLVDLTPDGLGRDVVGLRTAAERSGVRVVAATGLYREPYYPDSVRTSTAPELAEVFQRELREGIGDSGVRAGVIGEIGTWRHGISPAEERVFRAAAIAQAATGAPILTHTWFGELALEQVDVLRSEGADLGRVVIGHFGDRRDLDLQLRVLDTGASLGIDHVGLTDVQSDEERARTVATLVRRGFGAQLFLSCDVSFTTRLHAYAGLGYDVMMTGFVPLLRGAGLTDRELRMLFVDNARRLLAYLP
ncbi:MAG: phosphotriesterase [Candidatus Limnocylindria bacterium]